MDNLLRQLPLGIIFFDFGNLNSWILGIDLTFDKSLQVLGCPDIKADALAFSGYLQADMFLQRARQP